jgi:hypothetical protein
MVTTEYKLKNLDRISKARDKKELVRYVLSEYIPQVNWEKTISRDTVTLPTIPMILKKMSEKAPGLTAEGLKKYLIEIGWNQQEVEQGIRVADNKIMIGGSIKDSLDYEFYEIPKHTWPNAKRLRRWVLAVVIPTNPYLKEKYKEVYRHRKERDGMLQDLTFVIGRSIYENGLQKKSHWYYEKAEELKKFKGEDPGPEYYLYNGKKIPKIASRTGHGGVSKKWLAGGKMR